MKIKIVTFYFLIFYYLFQYQSYSADRVTGKYDFKDFNVVEVSNGILLNITQSASYSIEANADEKDFAHLKVDKEGTRLKIYIDKNNYRKHGDINIDIKMPSLTGLDLSGGSKGKVEMDVMDNFNCELSGGAELLGTLSCEDIKTEISGGSSVNLSGKGNNLSADASGGSIFHLKDFTVKNVDTDLSGGSRLEIKMNGTLNVDASGGSRVVYYGNTKVGNTDFSGGSGISKGD